MSIIYRVRSQDEATSRLGSHLARIVTLLGIVEYCATIGCAKRKVVCPCRGRRPPHRISNEIGSRGRGGVRCRDLFLDGEAEEVAGRGWFLVDFGCEISCGRDRHISRYYIYYGIGKVVVVEIP